MLAGRAKEKNIFKKTAWLVHAISIAGIYLYIERNLPEKPPDVTTSASDIIG